MPPSAHPSTLLAPFQSLFNAPTWRKVQRLLIGTLLARGRRTVAAAPGSSPGQAPGCHAAMDDALLGLTHFERTGANATEPVLVKTGISERLGLRHKTILLRTQRHGGLGSDRCLPTQYPTQTV